MAGRYVRVGSLADLAPGKMMRIEVSGLRILLANVNGRVWATDDTCSHEEASLSSGSLRGQFVKCPLHGSRFSVCTGEVMDEPADKSLRTFPVQLDGESILVGI